MKRLKSFIVLFCCFILLTGFTPIKQEEVLIIQPLLGNLSIEEIKKIELDDGTTIGDHKFIIKDGKKLIETRSYDAITKYFTYAAWIDRSGEISLSLQPTQFVRTTIEGRDNGWNYLIDPMRGFGHDNRVTNNLGTLRNQFLCHFDFAKNKTYWNLEHWRPNVGYLLTVTAGCNPK